MKVSAFVFDLDGTLIDSKIDFDSMKRELQLKRDDDVLSHIESLSPEQQRHALEIVYRHELAGAEAAVKIEGAREFVQRAREAGKPVAIFTRNARSLAETTLKLHDFEVDCIVAREDAPPKPKPDGLEKIARELSVNLDEVIFIGDYLYDLQAGLAAGVRTVLYVPVQADFDTEGAEFLFSSYAELAERFFPQ